MPRITEVSIGAYSFNMPTFFYSVSLPKIRKLHLEFLGAILIRNTNGEQWTRDVILPLLQELYLKTKDHRDISILRALEMQRLTVFKWNSSSRTDVLPCHPYPLRSKALTEVHLQGSANDAHIALSCLQLSESHAFQSLTLDITGAFLHHIDANQFWADTQRFVNVRWLSFNDGDFSSLFRLICAMPLLHVLLISGWRDETQKAIEALWSRLLENGSAAPLLEEIHIRHITPEQRVLNHDDHRCLMCYATSRKARGESIKKNHIQSQNRDKD
jgi:hypothetical protein